jgi:hypothetical protein
MSHSQFALVDVTVKSVSLVSESFVVCSASYDNEIKSLTEVTGFLQVLCGG